MRCSTMRAKLNWLLLILMLLSAYCWINNRALHRDMTDVETVVEITNASNTARNKVRSSISKLNHELHLVQAALIGLSLVLVWNARATNAVE